MEARKDPADCFAMDDQNLIPQEEIFYIVGKQKVNPLRGVHNVKHHTILEMRRTPKGWDQRVTDREKDDAALNVDYMSKETRHNLAEWLLCDFSSQFRIFDTLREAKEYQAQRDLYSSS